MAKIPALHDYFLSHDGKTPAAGSLLRNPALAVTFRTIAAGGADAFYRGPIAANIVAAVAAQSPLKPATLSRKDLADYHARQRAALCNPYGSYMICGMAPPSSGGIAVAQILGLLSHTNYAGRSGALCRHPRRGREAPPQLDVADHRPGSAGQADSRFGLAWRTEYHRLCGPGPAADARSSGPASHRRGSRAYPQSQWPNHP